MIRPLAILAMTALPAAAQDTCGPRAVIAGALSAPISAGGFGEAVVTIGITSAGHMMETWANPTTQTWTILVTSPNGTACMVAAGAMFDQAVAKRGAPV